MRVNFGVVVFPGSNCDQDCFYVIKDVLNQPVKYIWHEERELENFDCIVLPGGFSYGDYLRTGAIARFSPIMNSILEFANKGKLIIGICNGFQILLEAGLLPGAMLRNRDLHFICKYVYVKVENINTPYTLLCKKRIVKMPIAHNEGNYYIDEAGLGELEKNAQIVMRYCSKKGEISDDFNPNGAISNIAGIVNKKGNVFGLMPHPERCCELELGSNDGLFIFRSIIEWFKQKQ
ncbi:MAG: phosphoribosylformylglycinamidine synthase subunit PurQ [Candidatus Omnitrophica bacterium]|nr:phosphoribosylformylglycinamidine synthase subunit PurQ [Candidatus Omnitrophota bacterium]MCM8827403.1 phosphoribosylformylglycinamidine synthase subunit PurQ [Candidatus Omnitrophota bacterium]